MSDCPFNLCDGSGMVVRIIDGFEVARFCKCHEQQEIDRRFRSAAIPAEFAALTIAAFSIDRYRKPDNRKRAYAAKKIAVSYGLYGGLGRQGVVIQRPLQEGGSLQGDSAAVLPGPSINRSAGMGNQL
jgi:hypothetical protein